MGKSRAEYDKDTNAEIKSLVKWWVIITAPLLMFAVYQQYFAPNPVRDCLNHHKVAHVNKDGQLTKCSDDLGAVNADGE